MNTLRILIVATALVAPAKAAATNWMAKLNRGEIIVYAREVKNSSTREVVLKAVIEAPPKKVWNIVSRCNDFVRTMTRVKKSREISRKGNVIVCTTTVDMPFPYKDLTATIRAVHTLRKGYWKRRWDYIRGDYRKYEGSWTLTHFKGNPKRTLLVYRAHAKPKAWVPDWIRRRAQKSSLPKLIKKFRRLVRK